MSSARLTLVAEDAAPGLATLVAEQLGERVGLEGALGLLDRQARPAQVPGMAVDGAAFTWDAADAGTRTWWPQGLTTSAEASPERGGSEPRILLAGWYAKEDGRSDTATRVSLVDLGAGPAGPRYDHVLLIEPAREDWSGAVRHRLVTVHAGGLAWVGDTLLVADTRRGVRVFDLDNLVLLAPDAFGRYGARFALPQSGAWRAGVQGEARPLRWSFLSLDRTAAGALWLLAGEYDHKGVGARLATFALDPATGAPLSRAADEVLRTDVPSMQGAVRVDETYVVSASNGAYRRGHLWTSVAGGPWTRHARALPIGPEDLSYDPASARVWTQTEYPAKRYVLSVPMPG